MKYSIVSTIIYSIVVSFFICGCDRMPTVDAGIEDITLPPRAVTREQSVSPDGKHRISVFVTRQGMGINIDGVEQLFDDYSVRFCPAIDDEGHYIWVQETKGKGYDIVWMDKSVRHSSACIDHLIVSGTKAVAVESFNSNTGINSTVLYVIDMSSGECENVLKLSNEYIEETSRYGNGMLGVLSSRFDNDGNKQYFLYRIDGNALTAECIEENQTSLVSFPIDATVPAPDRMTVDYIRITDNDRYLYNALKLYKGGNDAFAYGNDFRGRMAWDESYRVRGLCELYKKTNDSRFKKRANEVAAALLEGRNSYVGIPNDEWNSEYLWSSKVYSIGNAAICTLVENSEIMSALLYACNEGVISNKKGIVAAGKKAYDYFDKWYREGHYYLPKGMPSSGDGIMVPWNHQNSFAEVALGLYAETGEQQYLNRCDELITTFMKDWEEESDRVYWHYWPTEIYRGWTNDGRSVNWPSNPASEDNLFEDASHAGISVRLLSRYVEIIPNGVVGKDVLRKIESNMKYFCFRDGFSRFISGDVGYSPKAWHYWISPNFSYLQNTEFEKYVRQGYLRCFPLWDSQGAFYANAKLYRDSTVGVKVERKSLDDSQILKSEETFELSEKDLYDYIGIR